MDIIVAATDRAVPLVEGFGVTPFLSVVAQLVDHIQQHSIIGKTIALCWTCRDVGLLQYVVSEQLFLPGAGFVAEIVAKKDFKAIEIKTNSSNRYISLCVPELSRMWYPFAVASTHNDTQLRILFRRYGFFA